MRAAEAERLTAVSHVEGEIHLDVILPILEEATHRKFYLPNESSDRIPSNSIVSTIVNRLSYHVTLSNELSSMAHSRRHRHGLLAFCLLLLLVVEVVVLLARAYQKA